MTMFASLFAAVARVGGTREVKMTKVVGGLGLLVAAFMPCLSTAQTISDFWTKDWTKEEGYMPFYTNPQSGKVMLEVTRFGQDFLYGVVLAQGAGFTKPLLGRGELDDLKLYRFERFGNRVLLVHRSSKFREGELGEGSPALQESFAHSVIASFDIEAEEEGRVLIDVAPFLLKSPGVEAWIWKGWEVDRSRSIVLIDRSLAYARNTDLETLLTLSGGGDATAAFADVLADPYSMTLRLRHSFIELPESGFESRPADPRVGFFGSTFTDVNAPIGQTQTRTLAARWRLEKKESQAPISEPREPIVLHLDPAIPSEYRDAVRRGALWWNRALEAAGIRDAISLRELPAGATFSDVRFSGIQWVHRARGVMSLGQIRTDPRTAEIVHAVVSLDSALARTESASTRPMFLGAKACALALEPRGNRDLDETLAQDELAWTTAHEVGHILGLTHNMAASTYRGSVMDYLPPDLKLDGDRVVTEGAYPSSVGPYDDMAIRWAYTPGLTAPGLEALVREGIGRGLVFPQTDDSRWAKWDLGTDPVDYLGRRQELRRVLLSQLADGAVRDGEPMQRLYQRFESTYRLHEEAVVAAAQQVGGVLMPQAVKGDQQRPFEWLSVAQQRRALTAVLTALSPENLRVPAQLEPLLLPGPMRFDQPAPFSSEAGLAFSPIGHARDAADRILDTLLFDDSRLARLTMASRSGGLTLDEVLGAVIEHSWRPQPIADHQGQALVRAVQERVVDKLLVIAKVGKPVEVRAVALDHLIRLRTRIAAAPIADVATRAHQKLLRRQIDEFLSLAKV